MNPGSNLSSSTSTTVSATPSPSVSLSLSPSDPGLDPDHTGSANGYFGSVLQGARGGEAKLAAA